MKRKTQEKGITLIALVVTIVVLLILAGISLNMVLGENGIITKAKAAREKTMTAKENETSDMDQIAKDIDSTIESTDIENETLIDALEKGHLQIGDYVDYKPVEGKEYISHADKNGWAKQTYTVDTNTTWRVLGKENGQVLLISGSPIKKTMNSVSSNTWDKDPYLYMKGAYAYENCKEILNGICDIYSSDLGKARSITIEDVNKACGIKVENNKVFLESVPDENLNTKMGMGYSYTFSGTGYTPKSYLNGKKAETQGTKVTSTEYFYNIDNIKTKTIGKTTLESLLFDKISRNEDCVKAYWLASPQIGVQIVSGSLSFFGVSSCSTGGVGMSMDTLECGGLWTALKYGVRPVISINPEVTIKEVPKINDKNEESWSEYNNNYSDVKHGNANNGEVENPEN